MMGDAQKFLDTQKGGSEKIVGLGGGAPRICQHMTSSCRLDGFQLNNLMTCVQLSYMYITWFTDITNVVSVIITLLIIPKIL